MFTYLLTCTYLPVLPKIAFAANVYIFGEHQRRQDLTLRTPKLFQIFNKMSDS